MRRVAVAFAIAAGLALGAAAPAVAGPGTGTTLLVLDRTPGLRLNGSGGIEVFERRAALPVLAGQVDARRFFVAHRGTLVLRRSGRRVTLRDLELRLGRAVTLTARVGGTRQTVLTSARRPRLDRAAGTARLRDAPIRLSRRVAHRLGLPAAPPRSGTISIDATVAPGGAGGLRRTAAPPRPATAVDVTAATVDWHVRDSFVRYVNAGEGIRASEGARALPATVREGTSEPLRYDFRLPSARGWYDPPSGTAVLTTRGRLRFSHRAHGIDFSATAGQLELAGDQSRATFRFTGRAGTSFDGRRGVLMGLRPGPATVSGTTHALGDVPGVVPGEADSSVFAGFYAPGDPFGWMTVTFTTAG